MPNTYAVTGVASGIGAAVASQLKSEGHRVIGFDQRETSKNVDLFIALDLNQPESILSATEAVTEPLSGLCNNAGLPPREGLEAKILQVNFLGQRDFTNSILPKLSSGGSIVNMASRAGAFWKDNVDQNKRLASINDQNALDLFVINEKINSTRCYNLSKEAMVLWTMSMTEKLIECNLRINSISPGAISTGILDDFATAFGTKMADNIKRAGRPGTPTEVAQVVSFLLSEKSSWLKGIDLCVDGGMAAFNSSDIMGLGAMNSPKN